MGTKDSTRTSSRKLDIGDGFEEGWRPYSPKEEFVEGRRSYRHKRRSELLILEDSARKCREDNERIIHIQEHIMNDLKSLKTIQRYAEKSNRRGYVRSKSSSMQPHKIEKNKGY